MTIKSQTEIECAICGRDEGPVAGCGVCKGDLRHIQSRAYTLSDERAGRAPSPPRHGPNGEVGPKTSDPLWVQATH